MIPLRKLVFDLSGTLTVLDANICFFSSSRVYLPVYYLVTDLSLPFNQPFKNRGTSPSLAPISSYSDYLPHTQTHFPLISRSCLSSCVFFFCTSHYTHSFYKQSSYPLQSSRWKSLLNLGCILPGAVIIAIHTYSLQQPTTHGTTTTSSFQPPCPAYTTLSSLSLYNIRLPARCERVAFLMCSIGTKILITPETCTRVVFRRNDSLCSPLPLQSVSVVLHERTSKPKCLANAPTVYNACVGHIQMKIDLSFDNKVWASAGTPALSSWDESISAEVALLERGMK